MAQTHYVTPSPTSPGDGSGSTAWNAKPFKIYDLQQDWVGNTSKSDITIVFLAGNEGEFYGFGSEANPYSHKITIFGSPPVNTTAPEYGQTVVGPRPNRKVRLIGVPDPVTGRLPKLKMLLPPQNSVVAESYNGVWPPSSSPVSYEMISMHTPVTTNEFALNGMAYLKRIEIQNLEFDGNFLGMGALTSAANDRGYKSAAMNLWAESGLIRNVVLKNFGSVGTVPQSVVEGSGAGVEAFPLAFFAEYRKQAPTADSQRWIVEESSFSDFNSIHGGYGTMIMPHVLIPSGEFAAATSGYLNQTPALAPQIIVRRCFVEGVEGQAFGAAGATIGSSSYAGGRVLFTDNVVLNSSYAMNTDTGWMSGISLNRNVLLDIRGLSHFGSAGQDPTKPPLSFNYFEYSDNLIRIRGRDSVPVYTDYSIPSLATYASDPNLVLGRIVINFASGLIIQGGASNLKFYNNHFTTWPRGEFYIPNPGSTDPSDNWFKPIFVIPNNTYLSDQYTARFRYYALNADIGNGKLSSVPFEFSGNSTVLAGANLGAAPLTPTAVPDYTSQKVAAATPGGGFDPRGTIRRVLRIPGNPPLSTDVNTLIVSPSPPLANTGLTGVREVAIGKPQWNGNTLNVPVRVLEHRLPVGATPGVSVPLERSVRLQAYVSRYSSTSPIVMTPVGGTTDSLGNVTIPVDLSVFLSLSGNPTANPNAHICLVAWMDASGSASAVYNPDTTAWATHEVSTGTTVFLTASPDVGDDKNTTSAKRAKFTIRRTGPTTTELKVKFALVPLFQAPSGEQLIASYGTSGTADYYLQATGGAVLEPASGTPTSVTIPANSDKAVLDVVTRGDNITEEDIVRMQLLPQDIIVPSDPNLYAIATPDPVDVLIYDGPEWTIYELYDPNAYPGTGSTANAINEGVLSTTTGSWTVLPQTAGTSSLNAGPSGGSTTWTVWWSGSNPIGNNISSLFSPTGISQRSAGNVPSAVVGNSGNDAVWVLDSGAGYTVLKHLDLGSPISRVNSISADGSALVGRSRKSGVDRPVFWSGGSLSSLPSDFLAGMPANQGGVAYAVNSSKVVVGEVDGLQGFSSTFVKRAFRMASAPTLMTSGNLLTTPGDDGGIFNRAVARAVSTDSRAVGEYYIDDSTRSGISWGSGVNLGSVLFFWKPVFAGTLPDVEGSASGINKYGWIVGWSRRLDGTTRAVVRKSSIENSQPPPWIDLNDPHSVYGLSGWNLKSADAITDNGSIIGSGTKSGVLKGFLLLKRGSEN